MVLWLKIQFIITISAQLARFYKQSKYIYLPFVLRTPFFGGKKYLRRAKISVETSETRKRYDTCANALAELRKSRN